jgi:hypothetical protein
MHAIFVPGRPTPLDTAATGSGYEALGLRGGPELGV